MRMIAVSALLGLPISSAAVAMAQPPPFAFGSPQNSTPRNQNIPQGKSIN
jgi:hypothetical protein